MEKRLSIEKKSEGVLIKIKAYQEEGKQKILSVWLLAWTLCGLAIISQAFFEPEDELKTALLVFTGFWAYFEYKVVKAFRWRRSGEEQLFIGKEQVEIGRTVKNRGILKPYRKDLINEVREVEAQTNSFVKTFGDSYWIVGGERLAIPIGGKVIYFGLRINDKELKLLIKTINSALKND